MASSLPTTHHFTKQPIFKTLCIVIIGTITLTQNTWAKKKSTQAPKIELTEKGRELAHRYSNQLKVLEKKLIDTLPQVDASKKAAFLNARKTEIAAKKALRKAQDNMSEIKKGQGLVAHAKGKWIGGAIKGIKAAKTKIKNAETAEELAVAQKELAQWEQNKKDGEKALKERQAVLDKVLKNKDRFEKEIQSSQKALNNAETNTLIATRNLNLKSTLTNDKLDADLATYSIIKEATPEGLAAYAQQGTKQRQLIEQMWNNKSLIVKIATADGAKNGQYGRAMEIYTAILRLSEHAKTGNLNRLAIAISLEHAVPIKQRNAIAKTDAPTHVDPIQRYLHYEKAFLTGELDPAFKHLSTWDYRMVVNGHEPDEILAWGRQMLRNYRPDHVTMQDYRWRYVALVRSDIRYGSQDNKYDKPELQFFQNILMNGGICGRRAFIGRFILRAFGIPTTARPQRGHAALAHWTPKGWVICLGAGWGNGWTKGRYDRDLDFLANTQARAFPKDFMQVKRAQWIGDLLGEPQVFGLHSHRKQPDFWYAISLYTQKNIIQTANTKTLQAVGEDIGEANITKEKIEITKVNISEKDRAISINSKGVITIPATATSKPTRSNGKIIFMDSVLGGKQLHFSRNGKSQNFAYTFNAPKAGKYKITAHVVTPSWKQQLQVLTNGSQEPENIELPHTVGLWKDTSPVEITLKAGSNILEFSHKKDGYAKGFSIKSFTLTPVQ